MLTSDPAEDRIYAPEGAEDLYIYDAQGALCEAVQVKDYTAALTFSHFEPKKANSFFYRVHRRLTEAPKGANTLATYGPLGPELSDSLGPKAAKLATAAKKLSDYHAEIPVPEGSTRPVFTSADGERVLQTIEVRSVTEVDLTGEVLAKIKPSVAGMDPQAAFELLLFWTYLASEHRTRLSRSALWQKLRHIGAALAALRSHHQEWHRTIVELPDEVISAEERGKLAASYGAGVQATWRHILAEVDVRREGRLAELKAKFERSNVLLVHGASGQGKSTLAYRYLHDFCPGPWRFQVTMLDGREHALNVCLALEAQANVLQLPVHVLVDVAPNDIGWPDLVARLARNPSIKVLVVIREEDFRRAQFDASSVALDQVDLDTLTETEARLLYAGIAAAPAHFLGFEDAWNQFGGAGPLMEFTYLLQQSRSLRNKLLQQVDQLRVEAQQPRAAIGPAHLRLLALVVTAAEYECLLDTAKACAAVGLSPLLDPVAPFEREYLLRRFNESGAVGGLHAVRSRFLVEHLFQASPQAWTESAKACLPLLLTDDLERFLLCIFSRRPAQAAGFAAELAGLPTLTWKQIGGITRALLWLGLSRYEESNRTLLQAVTTLTGEDWIVVFDAFVAQDDPATFENLRTASAAMDPALALIQEKVKPTPKAEVFTAFKEWARTVQAAPAAPIDEADWLGLAEFSFWTGHVQSDGPLRSAAEAITPETMTSLSIETLSTVVLGLWRLGSPAFADWHGSAVPELRDRFLTATSSLGLQVSGGRWEVTYLVESGESAAKPPDLTEQSVQRLRLLRGLFPEAAVYAAQGLGLDSLPFALPFDPTAKSIPRENLPIPFIVRLNAVFISLVNYRYLRAADWQELIGHYQQGRQQAVDSLVALRLALEKLLPKRARHTLWSGELPQAAWTKAGGMLSQRPLPKPAVDEWGFGAENRSDSVLAAASAPLGAQRQTAALAAYAAPRKALHDYLFSLGLFFSQFRDAAALCLLYRQVGTEHLAATRLTDDQRTLVAKCEPLRRLCLLNLASAIEQQPAFQRAFRQLFLHRVDVAALATLEAAEQAVLRGVWAACVQLMTLPLREVAHPQIQFPRETAKLEERFCAAVRVQLSALVTDGIVARIAALGGRWEDSPALWICASVAQPALMGQASAKVGHALQAAMTRLRLSEWEARALHLRWPKWVIALQVNGRSLDKVAAAFSSLKLLASREPPSELDLMGQMVHPADWPRGLSIWETPGVSVVVRWIATTTDFVMQFAWLRHIYSALADGTVTADQIEALAQRRSQALNAVANPAARAFVELEEHLKTATPNEAVPSDELATLQQALHAWGRNIFPHLDAEGEMRWVLNAKEYIEHAEKMGTAFVDLPALMNRLGALFCRDRRTD